MKARVKAYYVFAVVVISVSSIDSAIFLTNNIGDFQPKTADGVHTFEIPVSDIQDYGFNYPVTFSFALPNVNVSLLAWHRHSQTEKWVQLPKKTSGDFFNGEEVVRFDSNVAYVSVAFNGKPQLQILVTDSSGYSVPVIYDGIPKYYDNRKCVVMASYDDCDGFDEESTNNNYTAWQKAIDAHQKYKIWFTAGVVTERLSKRSWDSLQREIDEGFLEIASHSSTHKKLPYASYEYEIVGSKASILGNLTTLPYGNFVYTWIEPFGLSDDIQLQICGENGYVVSRGVYPQQMDFWSASNHIYRYSPTFELTDNSFESIVEEDGDLHPNLIKTISSRKANSKFDEVYNNNQVYSFLAHIGLQGYTQLTWRPVVEEHLEYISGRRDVWYPPIGMFFLYQYLSSLLSEISLKGD
jgi:hypothetical protein